jgi:hypothetical protein
MLDFCMVTVDRTGKRFPKPLKTQATYGNYDIGKCWQSMLYFWSLTIGLWFMVVNATFKTFSVILWRSVLFVEETGVPVASYWQTLSHNIVSSTPRHERGSNSQL